MGRLDGKVAMVTGGAVGIGRATVELFAKEGAKVVVADIKEEAGQALAREIKANGGEALFLQIDVTKEEDWKRAMQTVIDSYGKLHVLVNNAGISLAKDIEETTLEDWSNVMTVNATGVFLGTKFAIETMKQHGEPCSIINRSSIDGQIAEPGLFAYCASKGAVTILSKSAALACGKKKYNIRVNTVHPGYVHTDLTEEEARGYGLEPEEYLKKVGELHPIGRIGVPEDIAYMDLYLASDESKWTTGAEFVVDGGWTAQ
ncbi:glucose 1-dehydrogenase [Numidum massiliense]|uniref:glucose 1-dehydrogenase n=1 Tax=Numidum massiliense TaxID=1522315 RepID=UPI0006D57D40|nr:glucose 1-dehydrogenase [Numidum massiliense]